MIFLQTLFFLVCDTSSTGDDFADIAVEELVVVATTVVIAAAIVVVV